MYFNAGSYDQKDSKSVLSEAKKVAFSKDGGTVTSTNIFKTVTRIQTDGSASSVNVGTKSAFVDTSGKRASITSLSTDESSTTFTIVGTDMSGAAQTDHHL